MSVGLCSSIFSTLKKCQPAGAALLKWQSAINNARTSKSLAEKVLNQQADVCEWPPDELITILSDMKSEYVNNRD